MVYATSLKTVIPTIFPAVIHFLDKASVNRLTACLFVPIVSLPLGNRLGITDIPCHPFEMASDDQKQRSIVLTLRSQGRLQLQALEDRDP